MDRLHITEPGNEGAGNTSTGDSAASLAPSRTDPSLLKNRWELGTAMMLQGWTGHYRRSVAEVAEHAEQIHSTQDFWTRFDELDHSLPAAEEAIAIIRDAVNTLEEYNQEVQESFDRWILWGLLLAAIDSTIATNAPAARNWFADALNDMISPLKAFVEHILHDATTYQREKMAVEIHLTIAKFSIAVTKQFERGPPDAKMTPDDWKELDLCRTSTRAQVQEACQTVEISIRQANEQAQKQALSSRQATLSLDVAGGPDDAIVPCISLPRASDNRFFDRTAIFEEIDSKLQRFKPEREFCSLALHGLGGVGKSEIALQYAHSRSKEYDAVLWILSENLNDLETSFTDLCLKLGLKGVDKKNNSVNKVILKTWLQNTSKKWLLIFDNAWSKDLLWEYWPVANRGAVLVTTRNRALSFSPASSGILVEVFDSAHGSQLLFSVLQRVGNEEDIEAAEALSKSTGGLPLALFNVAGLIQSKNFSIAKVVQMYEKHRDRVHGESQDGRTIDTIWQLSFEHLSEPSAELLGVLSLLAPDAIPNYLFKLGEEVEIPSCLQFMEDDWAFESDVLGSLIQHHLVKRESDNLHISVHRLVQFEFISYIAAPKLQEAFDAAAMLLYHAFPRQDIQDALQSRWSLCTAFSPHVLSIMRFYESSRAKSTHSRSRRTLHPLRPTMYFLRAMIHCSWYLIETARYEQSLEILQVCLNAWNDFDSKDEYPTIYTYICNHMGVANHWSGHFEQSAKFYEEVYKIYQDIFPVGHFERGNILCNLGNLHLSLAKPEAALEYHLKAETNFKFGQSEDAMLGDLATISISRGKCYIDLGQLAEARKTVNYAIEGCTQFGYTFSRAHSIRLLGDIEFAEGNLPAAKKCYEQSRSLLLNETGSKTHQMVGAAYNRLGCLAQRMGEYDKAMYVKQAVKSYVYYILAYTDSYWFREALKLADFNTFCKGYRARSLYMLSQALDSMPEPCPQSIRVEAEDKMHEANTLLRQILGDKFREEMCNMQVTFDNLVVVHVR